VRRRGAWDRGVGGEAAAAAILLYSFSYVRLIHLSWDRGVGGEAAAAAREAQEWFDEEADAAGEAAFAQQIDLLRTRIGAL
jgi:hypothetical protein